MPTDLPKQFPHAEARPRIYAEWEKAGYFNADPNPDKPQHTIMIPLPNVTGALHMGHALNGTLQDLITRWRRMQGYEALWMPGTDHAGIGTQAVVERRMLEEEGLTRHDIGREALVDRIWKWKDAYEKRILGQLREIGASCDWRRTRFTLDDLCSRAVRRTFFKMFKDGLIYRGKRLVNWDTFLQTAVADDEVFHEDVAGHFWTFNYPVVDDTGNPTGEKISFSTTRPETMLGDTAVCVHPSDERYKELVGRCVRIPLNGRVIPIIADGQLARMDEGTGAVKVTPGHDDNDYACGLRNDLPMINILNPDGTIAESCDNEKYVGKDRYAVRDMCVEDMQQLGHFDDVEDRQIPIKHSDRSKTPIEPYLSDQWFVKMDELAERALEAVRDGRVTFYPKRYEKTYLDWLGEKRDWCISRQLWWGHRIPVWRRDTQREYNKQDLDTEFDPSFLDVDHTPYLKNEYNGQIWYQRRYDAKRGITTDLACIQGNNKELERILESAGYERDADVLDTWFSSALWPHSTLGWPETDRNPPLGSQPDESATGENKILDYFYPGSVLVTSRDIITLWVARMVLTGLYNRNDIPFAHVCVHPKILDGFGQTMSKSKGNGVDPMDLIDKYGTDGVRFTIASFAGETQDVRLPMQYECPHCGTAVPQALDKDGVMVKPETLKTKLRGSADKPRMPCPSCKKESQFSTPQYDPDPGEPVARMVSERFEYGRNFANKLWNASRFALLNLAEYSPAPVGDDELEIEDRWILSRLTTVTQQVTDWLNEYHFDYAAKALYDFAWNEFCSFYVEMVKGRLQDETTRPVAQRILAHGLDTLLRLLHPMMPFITEEVWQHLANIAPERGLGDPQPATDSIMLAPWPVVDASRQDQTVEDRFARFQAVLGGVQKIRAGQDVHPRKEIEFAVRCDDATADLLRPMEPYFQSMAASRATDWGPDTESPKLSANISLPGIEIFVDLADLIDVEAEIERNEKELNKVEGFITSKEKKLSNANFVDRAPDDVVQRERDSLAELREQIASIQATLENLRKQE
jgi:valyl-tRNA synthetase